jgi:hypothetical protein
MNQPPKTINDKVTRVPIRVDLYFEDVELAPASGFFYCGADRTFLVTNWHVVSGRNPATRKPIHSSAAIPDRLKLSVPMNVGTDPEIFIVGWRECFLDLYEDEERVTPAWLVHPVLKHEVDIAVVPLSGFDETILIAANDPLLELDDLRLYPSMDVYVVGYPRGMFGGGRFPIWKRGSIASEPDFDIDKKPVFYIDTATREGMSGSPVYAQEVGYWAPRGVTDPGSHMVGKGRAFVGVYSGRIGTDDEFKVQLGLVWKAGALQEIIDSGIAGESSFEMLTSGS